MRSALRIYLPIGGGLLLGLLIGGVLFDTSPAIGGWIFGAGSGLMGGAFIAALLTNQPIVGGSSGGVRHARVVDGQLPGVQFPGSQLGRAAGSQRGRAAHPEDDRPD
jgi:hypothetical protein